MIDFPLILGADGRPIVRQSLGHPAVYLDTWAIRLFAEDDPALGARFRDALKRAGGTLILSHLNMGEFTFDDPRHAQSAGRYVDTIYPNLFLSHFDPFKVAARENEILRGNRIGSPAGDDDLLRIFAEATEQRGFPSVYEWFAQMHRDRVRLSNIRTGMAQSVLDGLAGLKQRFQTESEFAKGALREIRASTQPRATLALMRALIYRMRNDQKLVLDLNDAIDIQHSIVPMAYGDILMADRAWYVRLTDAAAFLSRCGITTRIARVFTRRDDGVNQALEMIESWPSQLEKHSDGRSAWLP